MQKPKSIRSKLLMCHYYSFSIISETELTIHIPMNHKTDMRGAINFAINIIPNVKKILVFADDDSRDIQYLCTDGKWEAFEISRPICATLTD